jgi:KaiC/GvpD/RAD55 family RecA-like ATPase
MKTIYVLIHDKDKSKPVKVYDSNNKEDFKKNNEEGYGVYFSANLFKEKRTKADCLKLRYVFADLDVAKQGDGQTQEQIDEKKAIVYEALDQVLKPSFVIDTKNGLQPIWKLKNCDISRTQEYENTIKGIIAWSKLFGCAGDAVQDVARVLRMPGYYHQKGEPYFCTAIGMTDKEYTLDEIKNIFYLEEPVQQQTKISSSYTLTKIDQEIERIDFQELITRAFAGVGRAAAFNENQELVLDGRKTGTFQGRNDGKQYLASSSHEPFRGNKITAIADILQITNKEARKWIIDEYKIDNSNIERKEKIVSQLKSIKQKCVFSLEKREKRYTWGTSKLDRSIVILKKGNLAVIGAKRSMGKTTYTFDMACKNAKLGHRVLYISLEMEENQIIESIARSYANITVEEEYDYSIPEEKMIKMKERIEEIKAIKNLQFEGIRRGDAIIFDTVKALIEKNPSDLVFIDNLDLISSDEKEDEFVKQKRIITSLMSLTSEKNIPIVLIHHYRKGNKGTTGMDELAGSGKIADGADIIINLSRLSVEEIIEDNVQFPESRKTILWVQKGRGYTDRVENLYYVGGTFYDYGDIPPDLYHQGEIDNLMIHKK